MTYNIYCNSIASTILCYFNLSSDQSITSTSNFGNIVNIDTISGTNLVSISNSIISLPQGYEFLVRFFIGVQRTSNSTELYTKLMYSNNTDITGASVSEIGGLNNNKSSIEDTTCIVNTHRESKDIYIKAYKSESNSISLISNYCYGYILGIEK